MRFDTAAIAQEIGLDDDGYSIVTAEEIEAAMNGQTDMDDARGIAEALRLYGFDDAADDIRDEYDDFPATGYTPSVNAINF